jgi:hypothetical protein
MATLIFFFVVFLIGRYLQKRENKKRRERDYAAYIHTPYIMESLHDEEEHSVFGPKS